MIARACPDPLDSGAPMKATSRLVLLVAAVTGAGCQPESTAPDAEPASAAAELAGTWTTRAAGTRMRGIAESVEALLKQLCGVA
jgi:hypothetical protein